MQLALVLRALKKNKAISLLLILQISIAFAILSNMLSLFVQRLSALRSPSGIAEQNLFVAVPNAVSMFSGVSESIVLKATSALKNLPDVVSVGLANQLPFTGRDRWTVEISRDAGGATSTRNASVYVVDADGKRTLGLELVQGREFLPEEYMNVPVSQALSKAHTAILTESLARKLYPGEEALGKTIFIGGNSLQIVGILRSLARPSYMGEEASQDSILLSVLSQPMLVLRMSNSEQLDQAQVSIEIRATLNALSERQVRWEANSYVAMRAKHFESDRAAMIVLAAISIALVFVTGFGISGLSSFWIQRRIPQIAVRRALGASRKQIIQYFLLENFLLCIAGCVAGIVIAIVLSASLIWTFSLQPPALPGLFAGALVVLVLSQVSTFGSVHHAASISPALASRL